MASADAARLQPIRLSQDPHLLLVLVGNHQRPLLDLFGVGLEHREHEVPDRFWKHVEAAHLKDDGYVVAAEGEHRSEVQVVGENGVAVGSGSLHQGLIRSPWIPDL